MPNKTNDLAKEYSNPNCYARELRNCSAETSGEHFLSKSVLRLMERPGEMSIQGPDWLPKNETRVVSSNSLKSNILCKKHNSDLSTLDDIGQKFCRYFINTKVRQDSLTLNQSLLERWMLKLLCGFGASGYSKHFPGWRPSREWLEILFSDKNLPEGCGLYYLSSNKKLTASPYEMCVWPLATDDLQRLIGFHFLLTGYIFLFAMSKIPASLLKKYVENGFTPIYRPGIFQVKYKDHTNGLHLNTNSREIVTVNVTKM